EFGATIIRRLFDACLRCFLSPTVEVGGNAAVTSACQWTGAAVTNQMALESHAPRMNTLKITAPTKSPDSSRLKGLGILISLAIAAVALFALTHTLKSIDTDAVLAVIRQTDASRIALAAVLVATSYASLTFYDLLALRTIGRTDVPYHIAALASFT